MAAVGYGNFAFVRKLDEELYDQANGRKYFTLDYSSIKGKEEKDGGGLTE